MKAESLKVDLTDGMGTDSPADCMATLRNLTASDLDAIAMIHTLAFPEATLSKLGLQTVRRYYKWQLLGSHLVCALGVEVRSKIVGYTIAVCGAWFPAFLRSNCIPLLCNLALRPWLLMRPGFGAQLRFGAKQLLSRTGQSEGKATTASPQLRLLVIAVAPEHQTIGIGARLLAATESAGAALSYNEIGLTVRSANIDARRFYERHGWTVENTDHPEKRGMKKALKPACASDFCTSLVASLEAARVRAEYLRRARVISSGHYGLDRSANLFWRMQLERELIGTLKVRQKFPLERQAVLDIGCGGGTWLLQFGVWGAAANSLYGIDLDEDRISRARQALPASQIVQGDASALPWPDDHFDVVTQFTVLTSILDHSVKVAMATEMMRVLKPDGVILWYDMRVNNPRNPNVRGISAHEIRALFPNCSVSLKPVTLAPPLARAVIPVSWIAGLALEKIPLLRTHYLGIIRKPTNQTGNGKTFSVTR